MLAAYLGGQTKLLFKPFEGYRTPERQEYLFRVMKTTKARAWESAHQYGFAVDFVPTLKPHGAWTWEASDDDWTFLHETGAALGLAAPIKWDKPHFQHGAWPMIRERL